MPVETKLSGSEQPSGLLCGSGRPAVLDSTPPPSHPAARLSRGCPLCHLCSAGRTRRLPSQLGTYSGVQHEEFSNFVITILQL